MFNTYLYCRQGFDHIELGMPCQDACSIEYAGEFIVAAVADGVGSYERDGARVLSQHSGTVARAVAQAAVETCRRELLACQEGEGAPCCEAAGCAEDPAAPAPLDRVSDVQLREIMECAFACAWNVQQLEAAHAGAEPAEADCTLTLAAWDGERLAWGQAGDSGLVVALDSGEYRCPVRQLRDGQGRVFPLRFEDTWEFGMVDGPVAAALLATDGLFERLCPPLLGMREPEGVCPNVDTSVAPCFMHHEPGEWASEDDERAWRQSTDDFLSSGPRMRTGDDRTMVLLWDTDRAPALREEAYYAAPDWRLLNLRAQAKVMARWAQRNPRAAGPAGTEEELLERLLREDDARTERDDAEGAPGAEAEAGTGAADGDACAAAGGQNESVVGAGPKSMLAPAAEEVAAVAVRAVLAGGAPNAAPDAPADAAAGPLPDAGKPAAGCTARTGEE